MEEKVNNLSKDIYEYLTRNGKTTALRLKLELKAQNTLICLALGWLLRDKKIYLEKKENSIYAGINL